MCFSPPTKWLQFNSIDARIKPSASNVDAGCYAHFPTWSERSHQCQAGQGAYETVGPLLTLAGLFISACLASPRYIPALYLVRFRSLIPLLSALKWKFRWSAVLRRGKRLRNAAGGRRSYPLFAEAREAGGKQAGAERSSEHQLQLGVGGRRVFLTRPSANSVGNGGEAFRNCRAALRRLGWDGGCSAVREKVQVAARQ